MNIFLFVLNNTSKILLMSNAWKYKQINNEDTTI
jgi:hypothetical protein